jgi:hypothetical protein
MARKQPKQSNVAQPKSNSGVISSGAVCCAVFAVLAYLFAAGESDAQQPSNSLSHAKAKRHQDFSVNENSALVSALEARQYDEALILCEQNEIRKTETIYGVPLLNWMAQFVGQLDEKLDPFLLCLIKAGVETSTQLIDKPPADMPPALAAYRTIPMLLSAVTERNEVLVKALVEQGADLLRSYILPGSSDAPSGVTALHIAVDSDPNNFMTHTFHNLDGIIMMANGLADAVESLSAAEANRARTAAADLEAARAEQQEDSKLQRNGAEYDQWSMQRITNTESCIFLNLLLQSESAPALQGRHLQVSQCAAITH